MISTNHNSLRSFASRQVVQNSYRLYLRTKGDIETSAYRRSFSDAPPDFFDDFLIVSKPLKYHWTAVEWEGVQQKIALMAEDLAVSAKLYHPEHDMSQYIWFG
jgi:hypothetical protein